MLKEFRVSNFRSIGKEQVFTMEACSPREVSEYPGHVIAIGDQRLLKVSSIYGPNGSGKTNLLSALLFLSNIARGVLIKSDARGMDNYIPCHFIQNNNYTKFDVFFVNSNFEIGYSLIVDLRKTKLMPSNLNLLSSAFDVEINSEELIYRKLNTKDFISLFKRNSDGVVHSSILSNIDLVKSKLPLQKANSFINYIVTTFGFGNLNNIDAKLQPIISFGFELLNIAPLIKETSSFIFTKADVDRFNPFLGKVKELLKGFDTGIKDLEFKEAESGVYCLYCKRTTKDGKDFSIQLNCESGGTKKLVNILFDVLSFEGNGIFIADDFDSHLHPKLIKALIELFTSEDNKNKQLIFNSHDITNMNNHVFRRDEIWFANRDEKDYSTTYIPLSNIVDYKGNMVRKDAVYGKQYLEGKYGADPFIKKGLEWPK